MAEKKIKESFPREVDFIIKDQQIFLNLYRHIAFKVLYRALNYLVAKM